MPDTVPDSEIITIPAENRTMVLDPKTDVLVPNDDMGADGKPLEKSE